MCATVAIGTQIETRIDRCPTCATVAMGTQFETRIERQIACQLEPKIDTEIDAKSIPKGSK